MLHTRLCDLFGIDVPLLNAPMGSGSANGALAAAVSEAGGLGLIGAMSGGGTDWLRDQIRLVRSRTDRPFGVGFISHRIAQSPDLYDVALQERVPVIAHSFADPAPFMDAARAAGAKVICQVRDVAGAVEAAQAGVDAIVAQGTEAGGHTGGISLLPLLPQVVDAVAPVLVIGAGGIADGRGLAAVLMLGAEGAWLGTAFLVSPESGYTEAQKQRVLAIGSADTVLSESFDIAANSVWPVGVAGRAVRNRFTERWHGHEPDLRQHLDEVRGEMREAYRAGDLSLTPIWAGEAAGLLHRIEPAREIVRRIVAQAEAALARPVLSRE